MDGGAWRAAVHGVSKSWTRLSNFYFTFHFSLSCTGEGNGSPLQCSCLENPRDGGAWRAAVYRVAQSRTWLKRCSSSGKFPRILSHAWFQIELAIKLMYSRFRRNRFVFFFKCFALWWKASGSIIAGMWLSLSCWLALLVLGQHLDIKSPWFQLGHLLLLLWVLGQVCVQLWGKDTSSPAGHLHCWGWRQWKTDVSSSLFLFSPTSCPILLSNYWQV